MGKVKQRPMRVHARAVQATSKTPADVKRGVDALEKHVSEKGYEDFHSELLKNPRSTDRGVLFAEGSFAGPSPNGGENRDPEDFAEYRFLVVEDKNHEELYLVEVYYKAALQAKFKVSANGLLLLSGEIAHI